MAKSLQEWLALQDKAQIDEAVNITFHRQQEALSPLVTRFMPIRDFMSLELALLKMNVPTIIGNITAPGGEVISRKPLGNLSTENIGQILIAVAFTMTSNEFMAMYKVQKALENQGLSADEIIGAIFGSIQRVAPALLNAMYFLAFKIWTTGSCDYTDPLTRLDTGGFSYDTLTELFPSALTGTDQWDDADNADGLGDLIRLTREYHNQFGEYPDAWFCSTQAIDYLKAQTTTRNTIQGMLRNSAPNQFSRVSTDALNDVLANLDRPVPPLIPIDAQFTHENPDGTTASEKFYPPNIISAAKLNLMELATVPTPENDFLPGIYTEVKEIDSMPKKERIGGMIAGFPKVRDGRMLSAQQIYTI